MRWMAPLALLALLIVAASPLEAQQRLTVKPDGTISFKVATGGVTRISVAGDRIKSIVADASQYEVINDADTGDLFMRFVGEGRPLPEAGFIVTESGATINYALRPVATASEAVLITLKRPAETRVVEMGGPPDLDLSSSTGGSGDGYHAHYVRVMRQVIVAHVADKAPPKLKNGALVRTVNSMGVTARVRVGRAGASGGTIRPQDYYKPGVIAVHVAKPVLGPNERSWIVVLEMGR